MGANHAITVLKNHIIAKSHEKYEGKKTRADKASTMEGSTATRSTPPDIAPPTCLRSHYQPTHAHTKLPTNRPIHHTPPPTKGTEYLPLTPEVNVRHPPLPELGCGARFFDGHSDGCSVGRARNGHAADGYRPELGSRCCLKATQKQT